MLLFKGPPPSPPFSSNNASVLPLVFFVSWGGSSPTPATRLVKGSRDAYGNRLKDETRIKMDRLRKYDNRSKFDETWRRNLSIAMAELDRMSSAIHLPQNLKEQSALLYRKALKMDLIRGRSIDAFVAATIYATCRFNSLPRSLKDISKLSTREHGEIARTYRLLLREMKLKMPIDDPMKFIPSIAS